MKHTFLIYESIPNLVTIQIEDRHHGITWETFEEYFSPPFNVDNIFSFNYEPSRNLYVISLADGKSIVGEQSLEINWIKHNWDRIAEDFFTLMQGHEFRLTAWDKRILYFQHTDWYLERHREQVTLGIETSNTAEQISELLAFRQELRDMSISEEEFVEEVEWPDLPTWIPPING
jgi:hypothetical protein